MKKRLLAFLLCGVMLLACIPTASAASYTNLAEWAADDVKMMDEQGFLPESIQTGDMNASISRREMCYIAAYIFASFEDGSPVPSTTANAFKDTSDPVINYAAEKGIVSGYEDNTFRPDQLMTRQEFFKTIWTLMGLCYVSVDTLPKGDLSQFPDACSCSRQRRSCPRNNFYRRGGRSSPWPCYRPAPRWSTSRRA